MALRWGRAEREKIDAKSELQIDLGRRAPPSVDPPTHGERREPRVRGSGAHVAAAAGTGPSPRVAARCQNSSRTRRERLSGRMRTIDSMLGTGDPRSEGLRSPCGALWKADHFFSIFGPDRPGGCRRQQAARCGPERTISSEC